MKAKRFVKEYANWKKKEIKEIIGAYDIHVYLDKVDKIDNVVLCLERGFCTVDDAMKTLSNI